MDRKYLLKSQIQVARLSRLLAKAIDIFIALLLTIFFYPVGVILAVIYLCVCDALQSGQSVGKKMIGMAVISLEDGSPCSVKQSAIRNLPLTLPLFITIIPLWGWLLGFILIIPMVSLEIYLLYKLDSGHRLGDVMADTSVMANDGNNKISVRPTSSSWFKNADNAVSRQNHS